MSAFKDPLEEKIAADVTEALAKATSHKTDGNARFKRKDFHSALRQSSRPARSRRGGAAAGPGMSGVGRLRRRRSGRSTLATRCSVRYLAGLKVFSTEGPAMRARVAATHEPSPALAALALEAARPSGIDGVRPLPCS